MIKPIIQDKLLFSNILWQKPLNIYQKKGRVLVIGGEREIKKTLSFCEVLFNFQLQKISLGYPDNLKNTYQSLLPPEFHLPLPSTKNSSFKSSAFETIKKQINEYELLVLGFGLTRSVETKEIIQKLALTRMPIFYFLVDPLLINIDIFLDRDNPTVIFLDLHTLCHILKKTPTEILNNPFYNLEQLLKNSKNLIAVTVIKNKVFIARQNRIVITALEPKNLEILFGILAAFWVQNIKNPFESLSTAAFVAKTWQENFHQVNEIEKAISLLER
ncbi:MAG: hypothetical protein NT135_02900 [Candidatus Berkelbacteria bacterium]|nr:hypothetical protein [Candidatus Berkelbacteria bacterium]